MAIPNKATGYGSNSTARNVFGLNVDYDLSSLVKYECYDNDQTFPAVDTVTTVSNIVLAGTAGATQSMVLLVDTSNAAPSATWTTDKTTATAGESNPNRMEGQTSYVEQDGSAATATTPGSYNTTPQITFNMVVQVPSDTQTTDAMGFDLLIRYTYTGTAPTPKFQFNEGTEGTPTWTDITPGTHGIKHAKSGATTPYYANIPESGTEYTAEGWVTT